MNWPQITWTVYMSLKLTFEAFRVFVRTECLPVRTGTSLVHMAWISSVAMLLWCGGFFSQTRVVQPPQTTLQYRDDVIRNVWFEWGLSAPVADFAAQLYQKGGWRPDVISPVGTQRPAQFVPTTADWISQLMPGLNSREPFNPAWTIQALVSYDRWLRQCVNAASNCEHMAMTLSGYNSGLG